MKDIIVVGAGPAGLAAAIAAKNHNLDCLVIDKGTIVNSIVNFPTDMVFFSSADLLEIGGLPFNSNQIKPTRREAVRYYQQVVRYFDLSVVLYLECTGLREKNSGYVLEIKNTQTGRLMEYEAKNIVFATGFYDYPKLLNVTGEDLPHVTHYYNEPFMYFNQDVTIIGAGNSAVEAALEIYRNGGRVTIINRNSEIKKGVKYWILPDILNRIDEGKIRFIKNARVTNIDMSDITYESGGNISKISAQHVLALTGYQPGRKILELSKVNYNKETLEPVIDQINYQSSREGIYFAGSLIAGIFPNRIFIENSREHGEKIVKHIIS
jgi:thioredoxin reductase (NADPH)